MGLFDSFLIDEIEDEEAHEYQTKQGECCLDRYHLGDQVNEGFPSIGIVECYDYSSSKKAMIYRYAVIHHQKFVAMEETKELAEQALTRILLDHEKKAQSL